MKILIWQIRRSKNLSLYQLQCLTGISKSALNNFENGKTSPTLLQMEKIAKALDRKITDLFESDYK